MKIKLSIILPVFNEVYNLKKLLQNWDLALKKKKFFNYEFVIVEDGSTDGTKELIKELCKKFRINNLSQTKRRGYSRAIVDGIYKSQGQFILCVDSDNQIRVNSLINNINKLPKKNFFVIGQRNPRRDPTVRLLYSRLFKIFYDFLFKNKLHDPSCPFVIGHKADFIKLSKKKLLLTREAFWWGFVAIAIKKKFQFNEIKIKHYYRTAGISGYNFFNLPKIILKNTIAMLKIRFIN
jgi:glycosyltransferase involved in cell wall biosynthesis